MENVETRHHLLAIRVNWLKWLAQPILFIWRMLVTAVYYLLDGFKLAWKGFLKSFVKEAWVISAIGCSATAFVVLLGVYLSTGLDTPIFILLGSIIALLPLGWTFGEITSILKTSEEGKIKSTKLIHITGNGNNVLKQIAIYVLAIFAVVALEAILDTLGLINTNFGVIALSIISLPLVLLSVIIFFLLLVIFIGFPYISAHLLHYQSNKTSFLEKNIDITFSLLKIAMKNFFKSLIMSPSSALLGIIAIIPASIVVGGSISITMGILGIVSGDVFGTIMALPTLLYGTPWVFYVSGFFLLITMSVVIGILYSGLLVNSMSGIYQLYIQGNTPMSEKPVDAPVAPETPTPVSPETPEAPISQDSNQSFGNNDNSTPNRY